MSSSISKHIVKHLPRFNKFVVELQGEEALLEYRLLPKQVIELLHTVTPPSHTRQGIAKLLTEEAFEYAINHNFKVLPTCTYTQHYLAVSAPIKHQQQVLK